MNRRLAIYAALLGWFATAALAQSGAPARAPQAQPARPPMFFSEGWKVLSTPPDDHGAWPASQGAVASSSLELQLHGASAKDIQLVAVRGSADLYPLNLWTGTTTSPSAATLRDRDRFVDLSSPLAKIRWVVRTSGFHQIRPVLKLADGTWLVGDRTTGPFSDFNQADVTIADVRWLKLDIDRVVTVGTWVEHPDLRRVDSVGFADLLPGSGHGPGGYVNVGRIEVYGEAVKR
ncbi:MAG TPA: hypothetical protein VMV37_00665 [Gammaproteobacteria bacterium]|nr:hypothetical protein [Gammaproteobacteria bacterium]